MIFSVSIKSNFPQPAQKPLHAQSINKTIIYKLNLLMFPGSLFLSLITAFTSRVVTPIPCVSEYISQLVRLNARKSVFDRLPISLLSCQSSGMTLAHNWKEIKTRKKKI